MMKLNPEILKKNGKAQFAVFSWEDYLKIKEALEDADDLRELRRAKDADTGAAGISLDEMKRRLGKKRAKPTVA